MHKLIFAMLIITLSVVGCTTKPEVSKPETIILRVDSEIPVKVTVDHVKDCAGNWNFCKYQ